jgi:hypothetical protein
MGRLTLPAVLVLSAAACTGRIGDPVGQQPGSAAASTGQTGGSGPGSTGGMTNNPNPGAGGGTTTGPVTGNGGMSGGGVPTPTSADAPTTFACDPSLAPPADQLRALTTAQVQNTISDLLTWAMGSASTAATIMKEVAGPMGALPANVPVVPTNDADLATAFPDGGWLRADQDQQFTRVQGYYNIGVAVGQAATNSSARLGALVGACATDADTSNDAACLSDFITRFGARALRRPLTSDDVTFYQGVYGSSTTASAAAYADVIAVMLNAPDFLYFVEHGDQPVTGQPGVYTLSPYELASRLSYHVWDTMPDDALWQAASDGSLLQDSVYQAQVDRLFASPRAQTTMNRFFEDYLQVNNSGGPRGTGGLNYHDLTSRVGTPMFTAFAGANVPTSSTYQDMVDDAVGMLDYYTWTAPGTVQDLLTSPLSFARAADVAAIYGVPVWDGTSAPPKFPDGQRPGLFTRALVVAAGLDTAPILKGVYLRRYVLCDTIGRPPPAAANAMVVLSTTQTTRQVTEALTSPSACSGCHTAFLNPLGFATENFDGLGRLRTMETLFNADGSIATKLPVDTSTTPHVLMADNATTAAGAADVMDQIASSHKPEACLTRNYFRYVFGRFENLSLDGCSLEMMRQTLDEGGHLIDMLKSVSRTPAFKERAFQ